MEGHPCQLHPLRVAIFAGAFVFGVGFDVGVQSFWDNWNKGRQWKDIRANYIQDDDS